MTDYYKYVSIEIPLATYGTASEAIINIVKSIHAIQWFQTGSKCPINVRGLLNEHLGRVGARFGAIVPHSVEVCFLSGSPDVVNPEQTLPQSNGTFRELAEALDEVVSIIAQTMYRLIESRSDLELLIGPPLWMKGSMICMHLFAAKPENLYSIGLRRDRKDGEVAWELLCRAEHQIWHGIMWELLSSALNSANPFAPLIELYRLGYFPLGWKDGVAYVYSYS